LAASLASVSSAAELARSQHLWTIPIEAVMRTPVTTITSTATIQEAAALMRTKKIGCLPVVDKDTLVGIITDYDLLRALEEL
jgi:CBS domain-containing protein